MVFICSLIPYIISFSLVKKLTVYIRFIKFKFTSTSITMPEVNWIFLISFFNNLYCHNQSPFSFDSSITILLISLSPNDL